MKLATDGSYVILELGDKDLSLTQDQILKNQEMVERLKKRIEEMKDDPIVLDLQKILDGKE